MILRKPLLFQNFIMDSTHWDDFVFRDGDIIIATYAKSGTTWMQQIVSQLVFDGAEGIEVAALSPWYDFRLQGAETFDRIKAQTHRRFLKTHLPASAMPISSQAKYIYIGRDGRDTAWSFFNHQSNFSAERLRAINDGPGRVGPAMERGADNVHQFYREWMAKDGYPAWSFWQNVRGWWALRDLPNVKLVNFGALKADLAGEVRSIADFLGSVPTESTLAKIVEHCSFDYMRQHGAEIVPGNGISWQGGTDTFLNKGTNGRWREVLSAQEISDYEAKALAELGPECAAWLAS
jgi:aryl sulfotransferase